MKQPHCQQLSAAELLEYWLDELGPERAAQVEEHLFTCASCTTQLQNLVDLQSATRALVQQGKVATTLTPASVESLRASGLRLREYHVDPGGSVNCTIAPDDDLVVSRLHAPLSGVRRLDLELEDGAGAWRLRLPDIGFDPASDEVVVIPKAEEVRQMRQATQRMRLYAMDGSGERLLGEYVFHHSRHPDMQ